MFAFSPVVPREKDDGGVAGNGPFRRAPLFGDGSRDMLRDDACGEELLFVAELRMTCVPMSRSKLLTTWLLGVGEVTLPGGVK